MKAIEVSGLVKDYGKVRAVDGIGFDVDPGKLFAFLGPNGAGKSTTINILCTTLEMTSGSARIFDKDLGKDDEAIRRDIGVVFQEPVLDRLLTVRENLRTRSAFYGKAGSELSRTLMGVAEATGISEFLDRQYGQLSGGQRRRADIARALMNTPKLLFLDEPTTGLDPQTRARIWQTVNNLRDEHGVTVFLTTHYMEEAMEADEVAIIDHGKIAATGTPDDLRIRYSSDRLRLMVKEPGHVRQLLENMGLPFVFKTDVFEVKMKSSMESLKLLKDLEPQIRGFEMLRGDMDDVFISVTGRKIREEGA